MKKQGDLYLQAQRLILECNTRAQYVSKAEEQRQTARAWKIVNIYHAMTNN